MRRVREEVQNRRGGEGRGFREVFREVRAIRSSARFRARGRGLGRDRRAAAAVLGGRERWAAARATLGETAGDAGEASSREAALVHERRELVQIAKEMEIAMHESSETHAQLVEKLEEHNR